MAQRKLTKVSGTSLSYDQGSYIGRGGFSTVFRGFLESDVYEGLAVKRIQIIDISEINVTLAKKLTSIEKLSLC